MKNKLHFQNLIKLYLEALGRTWLGWVGRLGWHHKGTAAGRATPEAELEAMEAAGRALGLVNEAIVLIDHLESLHGDSWPQLHQTYTGALLVRDLRPELQGIAAELAAAIEEGSTEEAETLAADTLKKVYVLLDRAEAELSEA